MAVMPIISVSELVAQLKSTVNQRFARIAVEGELSTVKAHPSGHWYFILKDAKAQLRGVMFRRDAINLPCPLENGMMVQIVGYLDVYEKDGQTQIYAQRLRLVGEGQQKTARELLYVRLKTEGLFDRPKRRWPLIPRAIGMITAESGAARRDIEAVIQRRFPGMRVLLEPATVQGTEAHASILEALQRMVHQPVDVVIIGRGGGSKEDLTVFDDEQVVRAVAQYPLPVISAVGHEIDTTLTDLAADQRAPTPSAAAELAVPEVQRLREQLVQVQQRLQSASAHQLQSAMQSLATWTQRPIFQHPERLAEPYQRAIDRWMERLDRIQERYWASHEHRLSMLQTRIQSNDPRAILGRGYAYVTDPVGQIVTATTATNQVQIHWMDGTRPYVAATERSAEGQ